MLTIFQATTPDDSVFWVWLIGSILVVYAIMFAAFIVIAVAQWKLYTKAGQPGWAVFVPIYNILVLLDIIRKPRMWLGYMIGAIVLQFVMNMTVIFFFNNDESTTTLMPVLVGVASFAVYIINLVLGVRIIHGLSLAFGKTAAFTAGMIFLPFVFIPILGFGRAQYQYNPRNVTL